MTENVLAELINFGIYLLCGVVIGIFFDVFRILRKTFKTNNFVTYVEDTIFGVISGLFVISMFFIFSNGELRFYIFIALLLGLVMYFCTVSKYIIKVNVWIITLLKRILGFIFSPLRKFSILLVVKPLSIVKRKVKIARIKIKSTFIRQKNIKKSKNEEGFLQKM